MTLAKLIAFMKKKGYHYTERYEAVPKYIDYPDSYRTLRSSILIEGFRRENVFLPITKTSKGFELESEDAMYALGLKYKSLTDDRPWNYTDLADSFV